MNRNWEKKIYDTNDEKWLKLVESLDSDVFYLPEYFKLFHETYGYEAELFYFGDNDNFIIYPYLKKKINDFEFYNDSKVLYDITTVEYGGPIVTIKNQELKKELVDMFIVSFKKYCESNNIVTEFTRLHPLFQNHKLLINSEKLKTIFYINLTESIDKIRSNYNKKCRNSVNKAKKENVSIELNSDKKSMKEFYKIYLKKMKEINANKFYNYSEKYMYRLLELLNKNATIRIFSAKLNKKTIASSIFLGYKNILYYYLSTSDRNYSKYCGNNLIIDKAIEWAKSNSYDFLVLGGYYKDESLAKFKSGFTNLKKDFYRYKKTHNKKLYSYLFNMRKKYDKDNNITCDYDYFPEYRACLE